MSHRPSIDLASIGDRALTVKARRNTYKHRNILVIAQGVGLTEHGDVLDRSEIPGFLLEADPMLVVTGDTADLLNICLSAHAPDFNFKAPEARDTDPDGKDIMSMSNPRVTHLGWMRGAPGHKGKRKGRRKGMHMVWSVFDMMRNPKDLIPTNDHHNMLAFALDLRDWCKDNDFKLPTSLGGLANTFLRDTRFFPAARGRVPAATNERVRPYLPGVYSELRGDTMKVYNAVALDQRRAYHKAAQTVPIPDPTNLFAKGYYHDPDNAPVWVKSGSKVYNKVINQYGLIAVRATSRNSYKNEVRIPAINYNDTRTIYLWTNEVDHAQHHGLDILGIVAAWTSDTADDGIKTYAKFAENAIDNASEYRAQWLKPTLHALYGLLGARPKHLVMHYRYANGNNDILVLRGHPFNVHTVDAGAQHFPTTNTAALGTLQAEIRKRTMDYANDLISEGVQVLHIHADGIHVAGALPLVPEQVWSIKPKTNLKYIDKVSWLADEGDCLPGRDIRARVETRRHATNVLINRANLRRRVSQ